MEKQPASLSRPDIAPRSRSRPAANLEVELKLLASPAAIELIRGAPVIARHARNRGVVRHFDTVYYDTPDRALCRQRTSLREAPWYSLRSDPEAYLSRPAAFRAAAMADGG